MVYVLHGLNSWQLQLFGIIILSAVGLLMILNGNSLIIRLSQDALVVDQSFVHQISLQLEAKTYSSHTIIHTFIQIYCNTSNKSHYCLHIHQRLYKYTIKNSYLSFPHRIMRTHHWRNTWSCPPPLNSFKKAGRGKKTCETPPTRDGNFLLRYHLDTYPHPKDEGLVLGIPGWPSHKLFHGSPILVMTRIRMLGGSRSEESHSSYFKMSNGNKTLGWHSIILGFL